MNIKECKSKNTHMSQNKKDDGAKPHQITPSKRIILERDMFLKNKGNQQILSPGAKLSDQFKEEIRKMNAGKPDFKTYTKRVRDTFGLTPVTCDERKRHFLGGFIEGEGSISIGAKKNIYAKFGVELDPVFNITQHINGVNHLYFALEVFQTGRIRYKSGSNATLAFIIEPRQSLQEKVCPFLEKYVYSLSSPTKQLRYQSFKKMLNLFDDNAHLDRERFIHELLPIWDSMRMQRGYEGETFQTLKEAQDFVRSFSK
jgi:LAGLIDADG endonuclease